MKKTETETQTIEATAVDKPIKKTSRPKKTDPQDDWKDKYYRLYADFENYKKRSQKEKEDSINHVKSKTLDSILDLDNDLHIARKSIQESDGMTIILNKVNTFLKSQGIEEIQTESYDSDLHEVVSVLETGESKVIDVVSKGYSINGKPFRYPKIVLSR